MDAPLPPGTVGGPLFNLQGEMVGLTTVLGPAGQGFGGALAVNRIRRLLPELRRPRVEQTVSVQVRRRAPRSPRAGRGQPVATLK